METELGRESEQYRNIKTGRGGMVDVEFIAQYLLLRYGREKPALRCPNTIDALHCLQNEGLISKIDYENLVSGYKFLRRLENKLRLVHDQSVNELVAEPGYLATLAKHLGYPSETGQPGTLLLEDYAATTRTIREIFNRILGNTENR